MDFGRPNVEFGRKMAQISSEAPEQPGAEFIQCILSMLLPHVNITYISISINELLFLQSCQHLRTNKSFVSLIQNENSLQCELYTDRLF